MTFDPSIIDDSQKIKLTLDSSVITTDQTDFPLTVILEGTDSLHSALFTDIGENYKKLSIESGATQLPIEIESWDLGVDTYDEYTKLLIHSDTTDGSTTFVDSSSSNRTLTAANGAPTHSTTNKKFGASSISFPSSASLLAASSADFGMGTGDFTIDFWLNLNSVGGNQYICDLGSNGGTLQYNSGLIFYNASTGISSPLYTTKTALSVSTWYHIAYTRASGTGRLFVNGVLTASGTDARSYPTSLLYIGRYGGGGNYLNGYVDEFRVSKGIARWTEDFTPPTSAYAPTPAVPKAVLHTKVPTYSASVDTELVLSYDSTQADSAYVGDIGDAIAQSVWENYFFVHHFAQDPSGGASCMLDSTSNEVHGTPSGTMTTEDLVDTVYGKAIDFEGTDDFIDIGSQNIGNTHTIEIIFSKDVTTDQFLIGGAVNYFAAYTSELLYKQTASLLSREPAAFLTNTISHAAISRNADGSNSLFADGVNLGGDNVSTGDFTMQYIGKYSSLYYNGLFVELRVSSVVRSDDWIKLTNLSLTNQLITSSAYSTIETILAYNSFLWDLLPSTVLMSYDFNWSIYGIILSYFNFTWAYPIIKYYNAIYGDATTTNKYYNFYYWGAPITVKAFNFKYACYLETIKAYNFYYNHGESAEAYYNFLYSITGPPAIAFNNLTWDIVDYTYTVNSYDFKYAFINSGSFSNRIFADVTIDGVAIPFNGLSVECSKSAYYISAGFTLNNPKYSYLCVKGAEVKIQVQDTIYYLEIVEVSKKIGLSSVTRTVTCCSPAYVLGATGTPTSDLEYPSGYCSTLAASIVAEYGLSLNWAVYHKGVLVDQLLAEESLYANDEKPIDVLRKIAVCCGGIIQSRPSGLIEIVHKHHTRIPDLEDATPDIVLNDVVRFRSLSIEPDAGSGVNTVTVSSQATSDETWSLEEEDGDTDYIKILKGYNTPWDSSDVELVTSGGDDVSITYLGVFEETYPDTDDDPEVVEFINGSGSTDKYIYGKVSTTWLKDDLGEVYYDEDGTLTSEVYGESLLKIRYTIRYRKWQVTSSTLTDVQFILRSIDE
jgi:hypothetical protein